ncbi:MAG TPA: hypothetical protein VFG04_08165 [Planctomycetaceae bacterium]|jgi:hypothetical protein|nr:hypothetical protein [Planctomycetaceae bacterium]
MEATERETGQQKPKRRKPTAADRLLVALDRMLSAAEQAKKARDELRGEGAK